MKKPRPISSACQRGQHDACTGCGCDCHRPPWEDPEAALALYVSPELKARLRLPRKLKTTAQYLEGSHGDQ